MEYVLAERCLRLLGEWNQDEKTIGTAGERPWRRRYEERGRVPFFWRQSLTWLLHKLNTTIVRFLQVFDEIGHTSSQLTHLGHMSLP
jgi:hypothetical protein